MIVMYKHLFKLMWNKRSQNFLLLSEIFISFMVIFVLFSFLVYYYQNYRKPIGMNYENVWSVQFDSRELPKQSDSLKTYYEQLQKSLRGMPQIKEVTYSSSNFPYANNVIYNGFSANNKDISNVNSLVGGDAYDKVLGMKLVAGRWFNANDNVFKNKPIIINETLKKEIFGDKDAIGKLIGHDNDPANKQKIIGVVQDVKMSGDLYPAGRSSYSRVDSYYRYINFVLLKVNQSADANFESKLYKYLGNAFKNGSIEISYLKDMRDTKNKATLIPVIIFSIIAGFLIINVALGLFGVLWYNISKRRGEIGLRRAIGATGTSVSSQLVKESLVLATLSIIVGCFFALQFPLLNVFDLAATVYLYAIVLTMAFIYLLVIACSVYPGMQAAAIHPATALHEE
jgi:putative ABC transport system permease protein